MNSLFSISSVLFCAGTVGSLAIELPQANYPKASSLEKIAPLKKKEIPFRVQKKQNHKNIAYLGVAGDPLPEVLVAQLGLKQGLVLKAVMPNSPAAKSGIQPHDIITHIDKEEIHSQNALRKVITKLKPQQKITANIIRSGKKIQKEVVLGARENKLQNQDFPRQQRKLFLPKDRLNQQDFRHLNLPNHEIEDFMNQIQEMMQENRENMLNNRLDLQLNLQDFFQNQAPLLDQEMLDLPQKGGQINGFSSHTIIRDGEGSIKIKNDQRGKTITVTDRAGKIIFSGPMDTEEDKNAMPEGIRQRVDSVQNGIKLQFKKGR